MHFALLSLLLPPPSSLPLSSLLLPSLLPSLLLPSLPPSLSTTVLVVLLIQTILLIQSVLFSDNEALKQSLQVSVCSAANPHPPQNTTSLGWSGYARLGKQQGIDRLWLQCHCWSWQLAHHYHRVGGCVTVTE